ncbi:MAG: hypothetical protein V2J24_00710 [Pseudomonadales bacterium]|jgi:hypothetical protein|nr:hypothetical protein [Pseudomonadales bacterium]
MTESHARTTLDELLDGTLAPEAFSHRDHLVAAVEALRRHPFAEAHALVADGIRALAERAGAPEKFNATITFAYMSATAERMANGPCEDVERFLVANADLLDSSFLESCYSPERLATPLARSVPLLPDRAPT